MTAFVVVYIPCQHMVHWDTSQDRCSQWSHLMNGSDLSIKKPVTVLSCFQVNLNIPHIIENYTKWNIFTCHD